MSERSATMAFPDREHISKAFGRSFIEVVENFVEENERLDVIYGCLTALFNGMGQEGRGLVLKKIFMHFLRKFPTDFENTDNAGDYICKTLNLWRLFGKCSKTGPVVILEKIEDSYADCWQYYKIFAESIIEDGQVEADKLYNIFKKCTENCELSDDQVRKRFGSKLMQFIKFPEPNEEEECTVQFMQVVNQTDRRKSLAARRRSVAVPQRLDIVLEKTDENTGSNEIVRLSIKETNRQPTMDTKASAQKQKVLQAVAPAYHTPGFQQRHGTSPKTDESPASFFSTYFSGKHETNKTTLATARSPEMTTQTTTRSPPKDDFSVLKDPTVTLKMTRPVNQIVPPSPSTQSPNAKRGRTVQESTLSRPEANDYAGKENQASFGQDSPTICGTHVKHLKNHTAFLTSTPEMGHQAAKFFTNQTDQSTLNFNDEQPPSLDPVEQEVAKIINGRRRTIGPANESPEYRLKTSASVSPAQKQVPKHKSSLEKLNSLTRNLNQFHFLNNGSQSSPDVTGNGSASLIFDGVLNPWNDEDRNVILSTSKFLSQRNNFLAQKCPSIDKSKPFVLGDKTLHPLKQIGEGGFARVFKCKLDGQVVALKYQKPACPFELHMVDTIQHVLPTNLKPFVMSITDAFVYKDASFLVYEYLPYKTLLELSNAYRIQGNDIHGGIISLLGYQLGHILQRIHEAKIIHADLKPDNILVCAQLPEDKPITQLLDFPLIRLIDFGRAIDMNYFRGKSFTGKAKTQCFECQEMKTGRPWTYQTDFYGYVATIHTLIHHQYMETKVEAGRVKTKLPMKRRLSTGAIWSNIFDNFLNIPSCRQIPQWSPTLTQIKEELLALQQSDAAALKNAIWKLNKMIQNNYEKP